MAAPADNINEIFDAAIQASNECDYLRETPPKKLVVSVEDVAAHGSPMTFDQMPFRSLDGMRGVYALFDRHSNWHSAMCPDQIVDEFIKNGVSGLPQGLCPPSPLPLGTMTGLSVERKSPGVLSVLLYHSFQDRVATGDALRMVSGTPHTVLHRNGNGWGTKKALILLLGRIPGVHAQPAVLTRRKPARNPGDKVSKQWKPTQQELTDGLNFINDAADEAEANHENPNKTLLWILTNRLVDDTSPIHGWPDHVVKEAMKNKMNVRASGAEFESFFPLLIISFKNVFKDNIIPKMAPYLSECGLLVPGWPGVGKTQLVKAIGQMVGRYWIEKKGLAGVRPGWRRAKKLERFKNLRQKIYEMWMLDDPEMGLLSWETLKDFLELIEAGSGHGRYQDWVGP